jgi:hypothetical protein
MLTRGYKTTEMWVTIATIVGLVIGSAATSLPPRYAAIGAAVSASAYAIARGLAKLNPPKDEHPPPPPVQPV